MGERHIALKHSPHTRSLSIKLCFTAKTAGVHVSYAGTPRPPALHGLYIKLTTAYIYYIKIPIMPLTITNSFETFEGESQKSNRGSDPKRVGKRKQKSVESVVVDHKQQKSTNKMRHKFLPHWQSMWCRIKCTSDLHLDTQRKECILILL